ncbi:hypothetical protein ACTFIU_007408 [Dictyostelium citrinum]
MNIIKSNKKNKKNKINNENIDNSKSFFKVWRNSFIRYQIFQHLRLYIIHSNQITLTNEQIEDYKYLNYCRSIYLVDDKINSRFLKDGLPDSIESLSFVYYFNQSILNTIDFDINSNYHYNLKSITFGYDFNQEIKETALPRSLESLKFGRLFNQELNNNTFKNQINLKSIEFGARFNNKGRPIRVGTFSKSIESLRFGFHFNSFFEPYSLPSGLKSIELGSSYYQDINEEHILPSSITSLSLSNEYKIPITLKTLKSLPNLIDLDYPGFILPTGSNDQAFPCLKSLRSFIEWDDDDINSKLPTSLTKLTICGSNTVFKNISIPIGLKEIYLKSNISVDSFHNNSNNNNSSSNKGDGRFDISDPQLEKMVIDIPRLFPDDIKRILPKFSITTFKTLEIPYLNREFTQDIIPSTITSLTLDAYNTVFNSNSLPKTLKHLKLPFYNQPFINSADSLPWWRALEKLEFGISFFQSFPPSISFKNLKSLTIRIDCFISFSKKTIDTLFPILESIDFIILHEQDRISTHHFFQSLPVSIKWLKFSRFRFDKPFNDDSIVWPPKLKTLTIPNHIIHLVFDQKLSLPHQLESLVCEKISVLNEFYFNVLKINPEIKF